MTTKFTPGNQSAMDKGALSRQALFTLIAHAEVPHINTLVTRNRDSLDFHEVSVGALLKMMQRAYEAGYAAAKAEGEA